MAVQTCLKKSLNYVKLELRALELSEIDLYIRVLVCSRSALTASISDNERPVFTVRKTLKEQMTAERTSHWVRKTTTTTTKKKQTNNKNNNNNNKK